MPCGSPTVDWNADTKPSFPNQFYFCFLDNMYGDEDSESGAGWISWFCDLEGHEFFVEVSELEKVLNSKCI